MTSRNLDSPSSHLALGSKNKVTVDLPDMQLQPSVVKPSFKQGLERYAHTLNGQHRASK